MSDQDWQDQAIEEKIEARKRAFRFPAFMPFFWFGLVAIAGPILADLISLSWYWWAGLAFMGLASWLILSRKKSAPVTLRTIPGGLLVFFFSLTAMLYQLTLPSIGPDQLSFYHLKGDVTVTGIVDLPPEAKPSSIEVIVKAEEVKEKGITSRVEGKLLFYVPLGTQVEYGDRVEIWGELEKPDEGQDFSWREYLEHKGIYSTTQFPRLKVIESGHGNSLFSAFYRLRDRGNRVLVQIFPSPEDALLRGILLGDESGISPALEDAYRRTGTSHIIAISGFNMAVLAGLVSLFFTRQLGSRRGVIATILLLISYTLLVGASPSVARAAFMGAFAVIAGLIARKGNTLNSLGMSALVLILFDPHLPWDLGFQFSFLATLGLALFAEPLQLRVEDWFRKRFEKERAVKLSSLISEFLLLTLIAQAMVLPISIWHFQEVSWLFLLANPLVLPLQPAVMILGLVAMTGGFLSLPVGKALAWLAWPWAALTNWIVISLAQIPTQPLSLPNFNLFWVALYYLILFLLLFRPKPKVFLNQIFQAETALIGLALLTLVVWLVGSRAPDGNLHVHLPQGENQSFVLIEAGRGQSLLIAGSAGEESLVQLVSSKLALFSDRLDVLMIPDCKRDQLTGLFLLTQKFDIGQVLWACDFESNQTSRNLHTLFQERHTQQRHLTENAKLLSPGASLTLTIKDSSLESLLVSHEQVSLRLVPKDGEGTEPSDSIIASTGGAGFQVVPACQSCLLMPRSGQIGQLSSQSPLFWEELVSNGEFLSVLLP